MKSQSSRWQGEREGKSGTSSMRTGQTPAAATELFSLRSCKNGGGGVAKKKKGSAEKGQKGIGGLAWPIQPPVT